MHIKNDLKFIVLYFILGMLCNSSLFSQEMIVRGTVVDDSNHEPLAFANIRVLGKKTGSISNSEGCFMLSLKGISKTDTLLFSYVGYNTLKISVSELLKLKIIELSSNAVHLSEFSVLSRQYTPSEILDSVKSHYHKNMTQGFRHKEIFMRQENITNIHHCDIEYIKSSNDVINKNFISNLNDEMPDSVKSYTDYLLNVYLGDSGKVITPIAGQALNENWDFTKTIDDNINLLTKDIKQNIDNEDNYYKLRSGILAGRIEFENDTSISTTDDSLYYVYKTENISNKLNRASLEWMIMGWDFFNEYKRYDYTINTLSNDTELVYIIDFTPKTRKGLYKGRICVSSQTYALLRIDYAFDKDQKKGFSMLGIEYAMQENKGCIIYEKADKGYYVKYASKEKTDFFRIERPFALKQKEKRFPANKTLQQVKIKLNLEFSTTFKSEMLTIDNHSLSSPEYFSIIQPDSIKINRVEEYSDDIWKDNSIIEPTKALKEYKQQFSSPEYFSIIQPDSIKINRVEEYSEDIWKDNSIIEPTKALKEYKQQY